MILTRARAAKQLADIAPLKLSLPRPGLAPFINSLIEYLSTYLPYEFFSAQRVQWWACHVLILNRYLCAELPLIFELKEPFLVSKQCRHGRGLHLALSLGHHRWNFRPCSIANAVQWLMIADLRLECIAVLPLIVADTRCIPTLKMGLVNSIIENALVGMLQTEGKTRLARDRWDKVQMTLDVYSAKHRKITVLAR